MKKGWYYVNLGIDIVDFIHHVDGPRFTDDGQDLKYIYNNGPFKTFEEMRQDAIERFECDRRWAQDSLTTVRKWKKPKGAKR